MYMNLYLTGCVDNGEETDRNNKNVSGKNTQVSGMSMDSNNPSNQLQINNQPFQVDVEEITGTPRSSPERRTGLSSASPKFSLR